MGHIKLLDTLYYYIKSFYIMTITSPFKINKLNRDVVVNVGRQ